MAIRSVLLGGEMRQSVKRLATAGVLALVAAVAAVPAVLGSVHTDSGSWSIGSSTAESPDSGSWS